LISERLRKLLFELSSSERMSVMLELQKHRLKLSYVSKKLDLNVMEASRHLQRLGEAKLVEKGVDGLYGLTPFGVLVLSLLSSLDFSSKHRDYFMEHDTSCVPYEFVDRIGELAKGELGVELFKSEEQVEKIIKEAQQFLWIASDQVYAYFSRLAAEKVNASFDMRGILPEAVVIPDSKAPVPSTAPGVHKKVLPKVDSVIVLTEKAGVFCLRRLNGKMDYVGFAGRDPKFRKWCKDLFLYYWEKAKPFMSK
jgi:predicted transcriptional regulator